MEGPRGPGCTDGSYFLGANIRRGTLFLSFTALLVLMTCGVASAATCEINGGASYTNNRLVSVHYTNADSYDLYRIANWAPMSSSMEWYAAGSSDYVDWELSDLRGERTVYIEFANDPPGYPVTCQDSIILDTVAPRISTYPVTVKRGRVCYLSVWMSDTYSPKCRDTVRITTKSGSVKKKFVDTFKRTSRYWYWRYRCTLPRGQYRIKISCVDLAGNVSPERTGAWLRVR